MSKTLNFNAIPCPKRDVTDVASWDPIFGLERKRLTPKRRFKIVLDLASMPQVNKLGISLSDMDGINTIVVCHPHAIDPSVKLVFQRKHMVGEEKRTTIDEEV